MESPLRKAREHRELTLEDVAAAVGVSAAQISRVENGECGAGRKLANNLYKFFKPVLTREQILYPEDYIDAGPRKPAHQAPELAQAS